MSLLVSGCAVRGNVYGRDGDRMPLPRYWVAEDLVDDELVGDPDRNKPAWNRNWLLGWRDVCRGVDERTLIAATIPRVGVGHKLQLAFPKGQAGPFLANLSAFVLDYVARQKLSGASMSYFVVKQLPMRAPEAYSEPTAWDRSVSLAFWIISRVLELTYTAYDVEGFARGLGDCGSPFVWDSARRATPKAELDAAYFHLYGVAREDVDYIMNTFKVVRERDVKAHTEYRTKRLILERYDAMQKAIDTGVPYQTVLDPAPGHGPRHPARTE